MAYAMTGTNVQQLIVDARVDGAQVVNVYYYRTVDPVGGNSSVFLDNFIDLYRSTILQVMYEAFQVHRYWIREISDVLMISAGPPSVWRPVFRVDGVDYREGLIVDDQGDLTLGGGQLYLPTHEAIRVAKRPTTYRLGYFKAGANRYAPFINASLSTSHDRWTAPWLTTFQAELDTFNGTPVFGVAPPAGNGWNHAVYSPPYHGRVVKPAGGNPRDAAIDVAAYTALTWVGTQVTRRYSPIGQQRGA